MPFLLIRDSARGPRVFVFQSDVDVVVGRGAGADLVLSNVSLSRRHARFLVQGEDHVEIEDLDSNNGTYVNNVRVTRSRLVHDDRIRLGRYVIDYRDEIALSIDELEQVTQLQLYTQASELVSETNTYSIPMRLLKRMHQLQELRSNGALVASEGGQSWPLGVRVITIGPGADIPCQVSWGRGDVAAISWNGRAHELRKTAILGRVEVNGKSVDRVELAPGDGVR